jgi:hypothetical protein
MNIFEYEYREPGQNRSKDRPKAVRMYINNAPTSEATELEMQALLISKYVL